jgi:hypothetical protein
MYKKRLGSSLSEVVFVLIKKVIDIFRKNVHLLFEIC